MYSGLLICLSISSKIYFSTSSRPYDSGTRLYAREMTIGMLLHSSEAAWRGRRRDQPSYGCSDQVYILRARCHLCAVKNLIINRATSLCSRLSWNWPLMRETYARRMWKGSPKRGMGPSDTCHFQHLHSHRWKHHLIIAPTPTPSQLLQNQVPFPLFPEATASPQRVTKAWWCPAVEVWTSTKIQTVSCMSYRSPRSEYFPSS